MRDVLLCNQQLLQSALGSKTPLQAMKDWRKLEPELFKKLNRFGKPGEIHTQPRGPYLTTPDYASKMPGYFSYARQEIASLLPAHCHRILEVGCGSGATLRWLKALYPHSETVGIEYYPLNRVPLETNTDSFFIDDAETFSEDIGIFDLILFLDVLEHLRSPEDALRRYVRLLRPGGTVIVSVPAVSYIGVSLPLLLRRRFTYANSGILDRTHTRLFVEDTSVALLNDADLVVDAGLLGGLHGRKSRLINTMTFGFFRHYLTKQYIVRGSQDPGAKQSVIDWKIAKYPTRPPGSALRH